MCKSKIFFAREIQDQSQKMLWYDSHIIPLARICHSKVYKQKCREHGIILIGKEKLEIINEFK